MSRKSKPPYVWDEGSPEGYQYPTLFEWDFEALSKILRTSNLSEDIRDRLQEAVRIFFGWKDYTEHKPRRSDVISNLKKIKKLSRELIETFDTTDSRTLKALFETEPFSKKDPNNDYGMFDDSADFRIIHEASKEALSTLKPDKGGRTNENVPYDYLISDLSDIYQEVTGHRATIVWNDLDDCYSGPFFDFVRKFLEIIKEEHYSEMSLGSKIKRSLEKHKSTK